MIDFLIEFIRTEIFLTSLFSQNTKYPQVNSNVLIVLNVSKKVKNLIAFNSTAEQALIVELLKECWTTWVNVVSELVKFQTIETIV